MFVKLFILMWLSCMCFYGKAQKFKPFKDVYRNWLNNDNRCQTFFYADLIDADLIEDFETTILENNTYFTTLDTINSEKIVLTLDEQKYVSKEIEEKWTKKWKRNLYKNSKLVPLNSIDSLENEISKDSLQGLLEKLCLKVHFFSHPIFIRNNTICFFYNGTKDIISGDGGLWIYKKYKHEWRKFCRVYWWVK